MDTNLIDEAETLPNTALPSAPTTKRQPASAKRIIGTVFFGGVVAWMAFKSLGAWFLAEQGQMKHILPAWNSLITLGMVAIFVGLLGRHRWAQSWALGTSVLNGLNDLVAASQEKSAILLLGAGAAIVAAACLRGARNEFAAGADSNLRTGPTRTEGWITLGLIGGAVLVSIIGASPEKVSKPPAVPDDEAMAKQSAQSLVEKALQNPGSARFQGLRIFEKEGNFFLVQALVDAQNGFGAVVRNHFCVVVELSDDRRTYMYDKEYGVKECANPPTEAEVSFIKTVSHWGQKRDPSKIPTDNSLKPGEL